jgi:hypothetical protein
LALNNIILTYDLYRDTTIIESTVYLLTALTVVTLLAERLALTRCTATDTEWFVGSRQLTAAVT